MLQRVSHTIPPVYSDDSRVLILGTMPSVKSREAGFYYAHPQNRFFKVLAAVLNEEMPQTTEQKKAMLLKNRIALWDVLESCDISGSSDSSISNPKPNDISSLIGKTSVNAVFTTGKTAYRLYSRFCEDKTGIKAVCLPSPSPANAKMTLDMLTESYRVIADALADGENKTNNERIVQNEHDYSR